MSREFGRHLRVGAELQRVLNDLLQTEVKDPRLSGVRVSEVELSGDLGVARVFFSMLQPDADVQPVVQAFSRAVPFIRGRVGRELKLRRVPELRFEQDMSALQGMKIARLIADAEPDHTAEPDPED
jgi:ribosome-binding factor A